MTLGGVAHCMLMIKSLISKRYILTRHSVIRNQLTSYHVLVLDLILIFDISIGRNTRYNTEEG